MGNQDARLAAIDVEWSARFDVLSAKQRALKTTMIGIETASAIQQAAMDANQTECKKLKAEFENLEIAMNDNVDYSDEATEAFNTKLIAWKARLAQLEIRITATSADDPAVKLAALKAEWEAFRTELDVELVAYKTARKTKTKAWYSAWEAAYDEGLKRRDPKAGSDTTESCSICLEDFVHREGIGSQLSCSHTFHKLCLKTWMKRNWTCPLCRQFPSISLPKESMPRVGIFRKFLNLFT